MLHVEAGQVVDVHELEVVQQTQVVAGLQEPGVRAEACREVGQPSRGVFFKQRLEDLLGLVGQVVLLGVGDFELLDEELGLLLLVALEGRGAEEHFVEHDAQTPVVVRRADWFGGEELGRW